jgi:hypothetical protein
MGLWVSGHRKAPQQAARMKLEVISTLTHRPFVEKSWQRFLTMWLSPSLEYPGMKP